MIADMHDEAPTLAEVIAAWRAAGRDVALVETMPEYCARWHYQGVVQEHLRQRRVDPTHKMYLKYTTAETRAMSITREWLEFSP